MPEAKCDYCKHLEIDDLLDMYKCSITHKEVMLWDLCNCDSWELKGGLFGSPANHNPNDEE